VGVTGARNQGRANQSTQRAAQRAVPFCPLQLTLPHMCLMTRAPQLIGAPRYNQPPDVRVGMVLTNYCFTVGLAEAHKSGPLQHVS